MNTTTTVRLDAGTAALAAVAVRGYLRALDHAGRDAPAQLVALEARLRHAADNHRHTVVAVGGPTEHDLVTIPAAAQLLDCSPRTVERRIADGTIPSHRVGGRRRIRVTDLLDHLEGTTRP